MAKGKKYPLTIALEAVDKATAPLKRVQARLAGFSRAAGLPQLRRGFADVGREIGRTTRRIGLLAGAAGLGVAGLKGLIDSGDQLAKTADRIGLTVDALAQLRFAGERSGVATRLLDSSLQAFSKRLGEAKAGTGSLASFLKKTNPQLLQQLKTVGSTEQAFNLLADTMAGIKDPTQKAALASAAFSRAGLPLVNLLSQGSGEIDKLKRRYFELAGSQEAAARASEGAADGMLDVKTSLHGVRASILSGLAPAITQISKTLSGFFAKHRKAIAAWAKAFGKRLPGMAANFAKGLKRVLEIGASVVDFLGGAKNAAIALAVVLNSSLIAAVARLGFILATNPIGLIITAIATAGLLIYKYWEPLKAFFSRLWDGIKRVFGTFFGWLKNIFLNYTPLGRIIKHWEPIAGFFSALWKAVKKPFVVAWDFIKGIVDKVAGAVDKVIGKAKELANFVSGDDPTPTRDTFFEQAGIARVQHLTKVARINTEQREEIGVRGFVDRQNARTAAGAAAAAQRDRAEIKVKFENAPAGTRVESDSRTNAELLLEVGYQM